jgi:SAM-dependent methyltransferase
MQADTVVFHPTYGPALPSLNWVPAPRYVLRRDRILRHLTDLPLGRILEIGCGPAALLAELSHRGFDCTGVDRSEQALSIARHLQLVTPQLKLQPKLDPSWEGSFDIVLSFEVIEHLEDDVGALADWRRYLRPGGTLILSTPAHPSRWNAADEWAGHVRRYERPGLVSAVGKAGYAVQHVECYGFPLANLMERWRARAYGRALEDEGKAAKTADSLTNESGADRSVEARFWKLFSGGFPSLAMRAFCQVQRPFLQTNLGNGFIVIAHNS